MKRSPMLKNARHACAFAGAYQGCSCHNSKATRRKGRKAAKQREKRQWRKDQEAA